MIKYTALLLAVLLLAGCAAAPAVTTAPPVETTVSPVTTAPPETTLPPETTVPVETTIPVDPRETEIRAVVDEFLTAYEENCYLYTDNEYDHLTVLAAAPDALVSQGEKSIPLSEFHDNIQSVHDRESYWKESRQKQGILRHNYQSQCHFNSITINGDTATVTADLAMSFTYDDKPGTTSGGRDSFELLLVHVDGAWLIADVSEIGA